MLTPQVTVNGTQIAVTTAEHEALKIERQNDSGNVIKTSDLTTVVTVADLVVVVRKLILKVRRLEAEIKELRG